MKNHNEIINMKKNILLLVMSLLFFMATDAQAQECCDEDFCCDDNFCCDVDFCCFPAPCFSKTNLYAKFFGGANFLQNTRLDGNRAKYQTGYILAGSLGYCWSCGLRLEAEYAYRRNNISKVHFVQQGSSKNGHFQTSSYMGNLFWDLPDALCGCWNFQPFVGAGIGYDFQQMHSSNTRIIFDQEWKHFSWQLIAGLTYPLMCNTAVTLEYKFHQGGCHIYNHSVGAGLVYRFGLTR